MDHVVYVDAKAGELEKILAGTKTMLVRGAAGRKLPYGLVAPGDWLYFVRNNGEGKILARAKVSSVFNSNPLGVEESVRLIREKQVDLQLDPVQMARWAGKRFLVLIGIEEAAPVEPFPVDRSHYGNMDDWLPVGDISTVWR